MEIKRIAAGDASLVIPLFDQYRVFYKQLSNPELARQFITDRLVNNESVIFVAYEPGDDGVTATGFTQLYPTYSSARAAKNWILNDLYVAPGYRQQGIGESLIKKAMEFAKENGSTYVQLETAIDNFPAQQLYERIGFIRQEPDNAFYVYRIPL